MNTLDPAEQNNFFWILLVVNGLAVASLWLLSSLWHLIPDNSLEPIVFITIHSLLLYIVVIRPLMRQKKRLGLQASKSRLTQMMVHDLRKPFTTLALYLDRVKESGSQQELQDLCKHMLPEVEGLINNANTMISDVLDHEASPALHIESLDPGELIEQAILQVSPAFRQKKINFSYRCNTIATMLGDKNALSRVFSNLLQNAMDAVDEDGDIWFRICDHWQAEGAFLKITIGNTGSYINPKMHQRIFEEFFTEGKRNGTGLGLAISKKVIDAHRGVIYCMSTQDGQTEFSFTVRMDHRNLAMQNYYTPASVAEVMEHKMHKKKPVELVQPTKIAVIDDDPFILEAWEMKLAGANVELFQSPEEFLRKCCGKHSRLAQFEALIVDHYFSEVSTLNGVEFAKKLRLISDVPIFISTHSDLPEGQLDRLGLKKIAKMPVDLASLLGRKRRA